MKFTKEKKAQVLNGVGNKITLHRSLKGYSIEYLAGKCDMEIEQLTEIEAGKIDVRILNLIKIASQLDIELGELLP